MIHPWNTTEKLLFRHNHPPQFCGIVMAVAAVAAVGMTAYGMATAPGTPSMGAPPPPPSSTQYDDNGEIISTQTYDSKTNTWITRGRNSEPQKPKIEDYQSSAAPTPEQFTLMGVFDESAYNSALNEYNANNANPEYNKALADYTTAHDKWSADKAQRDADKQKLADLRTKMLDNLNTTPEDRAKAYAEYQQAYADAAHRDVDPRFATIERNANEQANATGMFGSRAYVDTKNELTKDKLATDTDIANQAVMAKEQLAGNDRQYWANMLNQIDSGARADTLTASQIAKNTNDMTAQNYAGVLGAYNARNSNALAKWQAQQAQSASYINAGSGLAGGLLYLYGAGGKGGGGTSATPSGGGVQKYSLMNGAGLNINPAFR